ncbi:hypothetical protein ACVIYH_002272 [Bradyrhizobium diazoefficiens]
MGRNEARDESRVEQLADTFSGRRRVVADDRETGLVLSHNLVEQALRRSDAHEAADHDARTGRDHRDGFFDGNGPHDGNSSQQRRSKEGDGETMLASGRHAPLICVKASHRSHAGW